MEVRKERLVYRCLRFQANRYLAFGVKVAETSRIPGPGARKKTKRLSVHTLTNKSTSHYTQTTTYKMGLAGQKKYFFLLNCSHATGH